MTDERDGSEQVTETGERPSKRREEAEEEDEEEDEEDEEDEEVEEVEEERVKLVPAREFAALLQQGGDEGAGREVPGCGPRVRRETQRAIREQLCAHVQLVMQVAALVAREAGGGERAAVLCNLLEELHKCWMVTHDYQKVLAFCVSGGAPAPALPESLFRFPGVERVPQFVALFRKSFPAPPPADHVRRATEPFSVFFRKDLLPGHTAGARGIWTAAEDALLLAGLEAYDRDWRRIHASLLPTKTEGQIVARFKNRSSRKADDNPIKQLKLETPLTEHEQQVLLNAVQVYGTDWEAVRQNCLPYRNTNVLRRFYTRWRKLFFSRQLQQRVALLQHKTPAPDPQPAQPLPQPQQTQQKQRQLGAQQTADEYYEFEELPSDDDNDQVD